MDDKLRIKLEAQDEVRRYLKAMPESAREKIQEIALRDFPEAYREIRECQEKFEVETSYQQQEWLMRRYVYLYKTLAINVGLRLIGAKNFLGFVKEPRAER